MMDLNPKLNFFYDVLPSDLQTHILQIRKKNRLNEIENAIKDLFKTKRNEIIYFKEDFWKIRRTSVKSYLKIPSVIAIINAEYVWDEYEDPPMLVNYYQEYWGSSDFKEVMRNQGLNFEWYDELWGIIRIKDEKINSDLLFEKEEDISPEDSSDDEEEKKFKEELTDKLVDLLYLESLMDCKIENVKKKIEEMRKANALKQFKNQKKEEDTEINKEDEIRTIRWTKFKQKAEKERKEKEYVYNKLKRMFKDNYLESKEFKYIVENDEIIEFIILKDRMKF
jgi:hypothetical protein